MKEFKSNCMNNRFAKFKSIAILFILVCVCTYTNAQKELTSGSYKIRHFKKINLDKYGFFAASGVWEDSTGTVVVNTNDKTITFYINTAKIFHYSKIVDTYKLLDWIIPFNWNVLYPCFDDKNIECRIRFQESMNNEILNGTYLFIDYGDRIYQYNLKKY